MVSEGTASRRAINDPTTTKILVSRYRARFSRTFSFTHLRTSSWMCVGSYPLVVPDHVFVSGLGLNAILSYLEAKSLFPVVGQEDNIRCRFADRIHSHMRMLSPIYMHIHNTSMTNTQLLLNSYRIHLSLVRANPTLVLESHHLAEVRLTLRQRAMKRVPFKAAHTDLLVNRRAVWLITDQT